MNRCMTIMAIKMIPLWLKVGMYLGKYTEAHSVTILQKSLIMKMHDV